MSVTLKALTCVHARRLDTAQIARKTGIAEALIYGMWIAYREAEYRRRERDRLQSAKRGQIA